MREYIAEKLSSMEDLDEKETLRGILEQVFLPLYDETMAKYADLEERVRNELPENSTEYTVYSTLLSKEKAEGFAAWLHPVLKDIDNVSGSEEMILDTIFIEGDYLVCREIVSSKELFSGTLHIEDRDVVIQVLLQPSKRYLNEISKLYPHFINNEVSWRTQNLPYIHKMFDVVLVGNKEKVVEELLTQNQGGMDWDISFGKHDKYIKKNMIPVWNVSRVTAGSDDFPIPVVEKKVYEYHFELDEVGIEHGYLADYHSAPIAHSRREKSVYVVSVPEKKELSWTLIKFSKPSHKETLKFPYPVISNMQEVQFADSMILNFGTKINTKAEIVRLINSFGIAEYIKFENYRILNNQVFQGESYESNFFIRDEIRDDNISKTLLLQFSKNSNKNIFLMRDVMSFVVSQIQFVYPEYNCVGALL